MLLKQLKQLTFSAPLRNVVLETDVDRLARFYRSTALCQSLTTSKAPRRLSRDDRRAAVESFVSQYRATNAGKFPSLNTIHKEVGGSYYVVREICQELKLKPKAPLPIVAKTLSEVSASVANDASSQTLNGADTDPQPHISACNAKHLSALVVDPVLRAGRPDTTETGNDQRQTAIDFSHPHSDETNLQSHNLVITTTYDNREKETAPNNDVDSKRDSITDLPESQKRIVLEECLKNSETEEEGNLMHLGSREPKAGHLEGTAVSAKVVPTETRQVSERGTGEVETGKSSSAWNDIMSFAKEIANFWRKG